MKVKCYVTSLQAAEVLGIVRAWTWQVGRERNVASPCEPCISNRNRPAGTRVQSENIPYTACLPLNLNDFTTPA